jgi:gluconokinase
MGVSGSGKTTVAAALAARLGYAFADADDFHPEANVAKMARGEPLTDPDREPWLQALAGWIAARHAGGRSTVLACSALMRRYRDVLRSAAPHCVCFIHLAVPTETLRRRMRHRTGHFMRENLLGSQLDTLEPLENDEPGISVDGSESPVAIVVQALEYLARPSSG